MRRRALLRSMLAAPLAFGSGYAAVADSESLWQKFYRMPLLRRDYTDLPEAGVFTHMTLRGESLTGIAERFYSDARLAAAIARWNDLAAGSRPHAGQEIRLVIPRLALLTALDVVQVDKSGQGCSLETVAASRRFRRDELFRLRVAPNVNGWLYAFNRDANGRWKRLHPMDPSEAQVTRFNDYVLPNPSVTAPNWFKLDHDKGDEELILLFSIDALEELADVLDVPAGEELSEKQEDSLDSLLQRKEKAAKGITRVEGDSAKREAGAIIALGPDSGAPILIYRMRLLREA